MKLILLFAICCLALHNGKGAPTTAVYKYVTCKPQGNESNCVTHQTQKMPWNQHLPRKLAASAAQYLEATPVEDERPKTEEAEKEEEEEEEMYEKEMPFISEEGESLGNEEGSGGSEGSAAGGITMEDLAFMTVENETGSGEKDMDQEKDKDLSGTSSGLWSLVGTAKPTEQELREDDLLRSRPIPIH